MKKILFSIAVLAVASGAAILGTRAFFSDTETSSNNTFQSGAIDLLVDSTAHYAGMVCTDGVWVEESPESSTRPELIGDECNGTWTETDLTEENIFFSYTDLKPGDAGENTISLHVNSNDAYVCATIDNMQNDDLGLTEPETEDGDATDGVGNGELANEIHFFAWADDGDNVWEAGELPLFSNTEGPASDVLDGIVYPLWTPATTALVGGTTQFLGVYWCYGDVEVGENTLSCNGAPVDNQSQTDLLSADISFYAEQARNNENFVCPALPEPTPTPEVTPTPTITPTPTPTPTAQ